MINYNIHANKGRTEMGGGGDSRPLSEDSAYS